MARIADRLPQNLGCVRATEVELRFSALRHGDPAYARIADGADFRIRERGPDDDAMGAYGFLRDAARLRNLRIRYREFMPVGVRPLLLPGPRVAAVARRLDWGGPIVQAATAEDDEMLHALERFAAPGPAPAA
jgi:hypothetical protein